LNGAAEVPLAAELPAADSDADEPLLLAGMGGAVPLRLTPPDAGPAAGPPILFMNRMPDVRLDNALTGACPGAFAIPDMLVVRSLVWNYRERCCVQAGVTRKDYGSVTQR
jgi:hypothetical protein